MSEFSQRIRKKPKKAGCEPPFTHILTVVLSRVLFNFQNCFKLLSCVDSRMRILFLSFSTVLICPGCTSECKFSILKVG